MNHKDRRQAVVIDQLDELCTKAVLKVPVMLAMMKRKRDADEKKAELKHSFNCKKRDVLRFRMGLK